MKKATKLLTILASAPLAACAVDAGGSLGLESGCRMDKIVNKGIIPGYTGESSENIKNLNGFSLGANGRLTLNDFYLRANGAYTWTVSNPRWAFEIEGINAYDTPLPKKHSYDLGGAMGYTFCLNDGEFSLAPEVGYTYTKADFSSAGDLLGRASDSAGTAFVGLDFNWMFSTDWRFGLLFDFHFLGSRKSKVLSASTGNAAEITKGTYMGPEAKATFDYSFTENWSMGFAYRFKYIFTGKEDVSGFTDMVQTWMTNQATVKVDYTF